LDHSSVTTAGQSIEIVALKTQIDTIQETVATLEQEVKETEARLAQERLNAEAATKELGDERGKVENLGTRIGELEQHLAQQTAEAEALSQRVAELEAQVTTQGQQLAERERERDQLRLEVEAARHIEADLRGELSSLDRRHDDATEALRADKSLIESQLERAREDRAKAQREMAAMKREAEASWAAERVENALLRERINDVAAEVARLAAALEGPDSPIDTILAEASAPRLQPVGNGVAPSASVHSPAIAGIDDAKSSLADRIRALQARASRLSSAT
jgi:chromosome segregation ATPase